jgi:hypothetical protein
MPKTASASTPKRKRTATLNLRRAPPTPSPTPPRRSARHAVKAESDSEEDEVLPAPKRRRTEAPSPLKTPTKATRGRPRQLPTPEPTPVRKAKAAKKTRKPSPISVPSPTVSRPSTPTPEIEDEAVEDEPVEEDEPELCEDEESVEADVQAEDSPATEGSGVFPLDFLRPFTSQLLSTLRGRSQPYLPLLPAPAQQGLTKARKPAFDLARQPYLLGLEAHERELRVTLDRTITEGEGNTMLMVGPRGVGKTAVRFVDMRERLSHLTDGQPDITDLGAGAWRRQLPDGAP